METTTSGTNSNTRGTADSDVDLRFTSALLSASQNNKITGYNSNNANRTTRVAVNGVAAGSSSVAGETTGNGENSSVDNNSMELIRHDVPIPTENGGFTHTLASRAKISAANKGKIPWNKGTAHTDEVRSRIAAGVRARNRANFLQKLANLGLIESEYEAHKKAEKRRREAERRARRTENGGFRPTEETKQKISRVLKEKYARGEVKQRKARDPSKVRRGFSHSDETRAKIAETLRQRWASDPVYRERMKNNTKVVNTDVDIRKRISESLRKKWQDPDFRAGMLAKISGRNSTTNVVFDTDHRERISAAIKAKWQDEDYRQKTLQAIAKRRESRMLSRPPAPPRDRQRRSASVQSATPRKPRATRSVTPISAAMAVNGVGQDHHDILESLPPSALVVPRVRMMEPLTASRKLPSSKQRRGANRTKPLTAKTRRSGISQNDDDDTDRILLQRIQHNLSAQAKTEPKTKVDLSNGTSHQQTSGKVPARDVASFDSSVLRLREERRDLYDLLYGDDDEETTSSGNRRMSSMFGLGDENLDTFDPYGLDDC